MPRPDKTSSDPTPSSSPATKTSPGTTSNKTPAKPLKPLTSLRLTPESLKKSRAAIEAKETKLPVMTQFPGDPMTG